MATTDVHAERWSAKDVAVADVADALCRLRDTSERDDGPYIRTSVMTHLAWVPREWEEAALNTLAGLEERHPSRGILLFPDPDGVDRIDAKVSVLAFPLREQRKHIAAEVVELRLHGKTSEAAASIVNALLVPAVPVFLRWRGRPPFGEQRLTGLLEVTDRFIVDSREWPDVPEAYSELPFEQAACSDIAWRTTVPWRSALAQLWPGIAEAGELRVEGPLADAALLAGWLRSRLERDVELSHEPADQIESISIDGAPCPTPHEQLSPSDLLSAELDEFGRDPIYEEAVRAAS